MVRASVGARRQRLAVIVGRRQVDLRNAPARLLLLFLLLLQAGRLAGGVDAMNRVAPDDVADARERGPIECIGLRVLRVEAFGEPGRRRPSRLGDRFDLLHRQIGAHPLVVVIRPQRLHWSLWTSLPGAKP